MRHRTVRIVSLLVIVGAFLFMARNFTYEPPLCTECDIVIIALDAVDAASIEKGLPQFYAYAKQNAVIFEHAYGSATRGFPGHIALYTGERPLDIGVVDERVSIPLETPTLSEVLASYNYQSVGYSGSSFVGAPWGFARGTSAWHDSPPEEGPVASLTKAAAWIADPSSKGPRFVYVAPYDLYGLLRTNTSAFTYPTLVRAHQEDANAGIDLETGYHTKLNEIDAGIMEIVSAIETSGRKTVLVVTASVGRIPFDVPKVTVTKNMAPSHTILNVPLIISYPNASPRTVTASVEVKNIGATLLALVGARSGLLPGVSLVPYIKGTTHTHQLAYTEVATSFDAPLIDPPEKYYADASRIEPENIRIPEQPTKMMLEEGMRTISLIQGNWHLLQFSDGTRKLYAVRKDPEEKIDVYSAMGSLGGEDRRVIGTLLSELVGK